MKTKLNIVFALFFVLLIIGLTGCGGDSSDSASTVPTEETEEEYSVNGYVQKGPFVSGSSITIQSLSNKLESTGRSYETTITDDFGTFSIGKRVKGKYAEIIATGFYFDEVAGELSSANYTLRAVADLSSKESVNVNVLTTLEKDRIIYLMTEGGKSFSEAKTQAETEILAVFSISDSSVSSFDGMNISQEGDSNAILLAISAILQADNSVAQLSELISKINLDIKADGTLDNESYKTELNTNAENLDLPQIKSNLQARYDNLGLTVTIPDFEKYAKNLVAGFVISSISGNTTEVGGTATFSIKLKSYPSSDVSIGISSSDTTEGTVSLSEVIFTSANWNTAQTITVSGVDDNIADGNVVYSIVLATVVSNDSNYSGLDPSDISVTNIDFATQFVAVGQSDVASYSTDNGVSWTSSNTGNGDMNGIAFGNGVFVAVGNSGKANYTTDGTSWTISDTGNGNMEGIAYGNGVFVAVAKLGLASYSTDNGVSWTTSDHGNGGMYAIAYGNGVFVAVGDSGVGSYTTDGTSWTTSNPGNGRMRGIAFGNGVFVAVGDFGVGSYTTDGTSWTTSNPGNGSMTGIAFGNGVFVAVGPGGLASYSTDNGVSWTTSNHSNGGMSGIALGNGIFVAVGSPGLASYSTDNGVSWTTSNHNNADMWDIAYGE
jgi:hypothetical protein